MNASRNWLPLALLALASCGGAGASRAPNPSPHFDEVSSHLHLGGEVYLYLDVDGDIRKLTNEVSELMLRIDPQGEIDREKIERVLVATGLGNLQALGLSSYEDGSLFRNRAYIKFDGQREGLMKVAGGAPHRFESLQLAPAGSDLVIEQDLHLKQAYKVIVNTLHAFEPNVARDIQRELAEPMPGLAMTGLDILEAADTKLLLVAKLDPKRRIDLSDFNENISLPHVDFALALDGYGFVVDKVADQYGQAGLFDVSRDNDVLILQVSVPPPPSLQSYKPVLARQGGRLWLASTRAFLDATLGTGGEKLVADADWVAASEGLATAGNGLSYVSSDFFRALRSVATQVPSGDEERALTEAFLGYFVPEGDHALAGVQVNGTQSVYYASNSTFSHKATLGMFVYLNPVTLGVLSAVALPSFLSYQSALSEIAEPLPVPTPTPAPSPKP